MITGIDPKVDYAFKRVFGSEENTNVLRHLLNAVLAGSAVPLLQDVTILNPFSLKDAVDDRLSVLDIKARDAAGSEYLLEMQLFAKASFPERLLYYAAKHYSQQLKEGEGYERLRPVIVICFVNAVLFPQSPGYHGRYELTDEKSGVRYSDHLAIHVLELPKFPKTVDELCEDEDRWTYFLRHGSELDPTNLPESLSIPEIRQATGTLTMLSLSEVEREQYESRLKRSRDEEASLRYATETALEEGLEKGLEQGRTEEARSILLRSGVRRHGPIPAEVLSALQAITDCEQLEALVDRMFDGHG